MKFKEQERVLCFHGPLLYECKVLSVEEVKGGDDKREVGINYFIHYKGWKRRWDEWVPESKLYKYNAENITLMKDIKSSFFQKKVSEASGGSSLGRRSNVADTDDSGSISSASNSHLGLSNVIGGGARRSLTRNNNGTAIASRALNSHQEKDTTIVDSVFKLELPDLMKLALVDDWENITKNKRLVDIPANPTVSQIFDQYRDRTIKGQTAEEKEEFIEFLKGLQEYFDKALGTILLYKQERPQYAELRKAMGGGKTMSTMYGSIHLLRLLVKLPTLVALTGVSEDSLKSMNDQLSDFTSFLSQNVNFKSNKYVDNVYSHYYG